MALRRIKRERLLRMTASHKTWGCPLTRSRTNWCHRICIPVNGLGPCGRIAPHSLRGRTDLAIERSLGGGHAA